MTDPREGPAPTVRGRFSVERLVHYSCGHPACRRWWTIGDGPLGRALHCPHCGVLQAFDAAEPLAAAGAEL